ncbi:hypothetical protein [Cryptosporangium sp. NPDC051539]|uniref:hypothetical protein n=1 Tax=Cryptosporangium sp. NPDC051539 TaxID=3363962 RepID=UPI0037A895DF
MGKKRGWLLVAAMVVASVVIARLDGPMEQREFIPTAVAVLAALAALAALRPTPDSEETLRRRRLQHLTEQQRQVWRSRAAADRLVTRDSVDLLRGDGGLIPLRGTLSGPALPDLEWRLTPDDVERVITTVLRRRLLLAVLGEDGSGKTATATVLFLALLQRRAEAPDADRLPVAVWVSLAGWEPPSANGSGQSLREWVTAALRRDYPRLLEDPQRFGPRPLDRLWESGPLPGGDLLLVLDGLDEVGDGAERRAEVLAEIHRGTAHQPVVLTGRADTYRQALRSARATCADSEWRSETAELRLASYTVADAAAYLDAEAPASELTTAFSAGPDHTREIWADPQMLSLLRLVLARRTAATQPEPVPVTTHDALAALRTPSPRSALLTLLVCGLLGVRYHHRDAPDEDAAALRSAVAGKQFWLSWLAGTARADAFGWWELPRNASEALRRRTSLHRGRLAVRSTATTFLALTAVLLFAAWAGLLTGFERAQGGIDVPRGLVLADVLAWPWPWTAGRAGTGAAVASLFTNPILLPGVLLLVACVLVFTIVAGGGNLEHRLGGRPQRIRPGLVSARSLTLSVVLAVPAIAVAVAALVQVRSPAAGSASAPLRLLADAALPAVVVAGGLAIVLILVGFWSVPGRTFSPRALYEDDRASTRTVALLAGSVMTVLAAGLTWWLTSGPRVPTLVQGSWIVTAAAIALGATRGLSLGAGLGCASLLPPEFGLGYAARLDLLEQVTDRNGRGPELAVLLGLRPGTDGKPAPPGVWRIVGTRHQFRHLLVAKKLSASVPRRRPKAHRYPYLLKTAVLSLATAVLFSTLSGLGSVVTTRVLCVHPSRSGAPIDPHVWFEAGQCVGFSTPTDDTNWFTVSWAQRGRTHDVLGPILRRIGRTNAAIRPDATEIRTIVFLAPLSRTPSRPDEQTINAAEQLRGAALAQENYNALPTTTAPVRLVVANVGNQFAAGISVARAVRDAFGPGLHAVIGLAQSRRVTRATLRELGDVRIIGASVYGSTMRRGRPADPIGELPTLRMVAPSDTYVAADLVDDARRFPLPWTRSVVLFDPDDRYFSVDLEEAIVQAIGGSPTALDKVTLHEHATPRAAEAEYRQAAGQVCRAGTRTFFAGRADQLLGLATAIRARPGCGPAVTVWGGPGAPVALSSGRLPRPEPRAGGTEVRVRYSALAPAPPCRRPDDLATWTDRATAYSAFFAANDAVPDRSWCATVPLLAGTEPADGHLTDPRSRTIGDWPP